MGAKESKEIFCAVTTKKKQSIKNYLANIAKHSDAICLIENNGEYIGMNEAYHKLFGFDNIELAKITLVTIFGFSEKTQPNKEEASLKNLRYKIGKALSTGVADFDWVYHTLSGETLKCHVWFSPVRLKSGIKIQCVIRPLDQKMLDNLDDSVLTSADVTPREIADYCLKEIVKMTNSKIGYVGFVNKEETEYTNYSWSRNVMDACQMEEKPTVFDLSHPSVFSDSVKSKKAIIINDYSKPHTHKHGIPQGHLPLTSCLNVPIFDNPKAREKIVLLAGVGNSDEPYSQNHIEMIEELMNKMWAIFKEKFLKK
ncbi:hypothetical protein M0811_11834 [Anaeramoeba ignava]|uniref:GAF domain-containing protein n=1 Tax=Anaeramoeba ignava TaxID=1746090 RepID=A0A9Q0LA20_ANAIG|nr:hypothetical protein M0811_11834 [Anaeramoeba ignava]|eukprot:Anaeramoba_ignava/a219872_83.p1 GENE.a219872_83~~a219872_83.p1  ORF type:complete len:312 (-),score=67.57 a219872_83:122-1057(-)